MSKVLGIVCARKASKRFPEKNIAQIGGLSLVERAVRTLNQAGLDRIVAATDFPLGFDPKQYNAIHLFRSQNTSSDILALQETVKWVYLSLNDSYKSIVFLMPNCPMVDADSVKQSITLLHNRCYNVVRSYNLKGLENGLIAVRTKYLLDHFIDVYCGCIICEGNEIHDEQDYLKIKKIMEG